MYPTVAFGDKNNRSQPLHESGGGVLSTAMEVFR
jgi:hypothetical protein